MFVMDPHQRALGLRVIIVIASILLQAEHRQCLKTVVDMQILGQFNTSCGHLDQHNITIIDVRFMDESNADGSIDNFEYGIANETLRQNPDRPCVRLLCSRGMSFIGNNTCQSDIRLLDLHIPVEEEDGINQTMNIFEQFDHSVGATCNEIFRLDPGVWKLNQNGTITTKYNGILNEEEYFLTPQLIENTSVIKLAAWICYTEVERKFSIIGQLISLPFMIVTFLVYASLPELRNVHGKSLMCYLLGLIITFASLSYVQTYPLDSPFCSIAGYLMFFWHMSTHFWLNVISFDMWTNFRRMQFKSSRYNKHKFLKYNSYAWGMPLAITLISFLMDSIPKLPSNVQPGIGLRICFFDSETKKYAFFYIPRVILLVANGAFFALTALKIRRVKTELASMDDKHKQHKSQFDNEKEMFGLFLRLFIVMGLVWSMDLVMWFMEVQLPEWTTIYLAAVTNGFQGVAIFFLFIMKRKVKQMMVKRWKVWRGTETSNANGSKNVTPHRSFTGSTGSTSFSVQKF